MFTDRRTDEWTDTDRQTDDGRRAIALAHAMSKNSFVTKLGNGTCVGPTCHCIVVFLTYLKVETGSQYREIATKWVIQQITIVAEARLSNELPADINSVSSSSVLHQKPKFFNSCRIIVVCL